MGESVKMGMPCFTEIEYFLSIVVVSDRFFMIEMEKDRC